MFKSILFFAFVALVASQDFTDIFIIDDFEVSTPAMVIVTSDTNIPSSLTAFTQSSEILGGERDVELSVIRGATNLVLSSGVANGLFSVAAPNGAGGESSIFYDGIDGSVSVAVNGLGGIDFTVQNAFAFRTIIASDLDTVVVFRVFAGSAECTAALDIEAGDQEREFIVEYADFSSGCDFTNVGAVEIQALIDDNVDINLNLFSVYGPVPVTQSSSPSPTANPSSSRTPTTNPSSSRTPAATPTQTPAPQCQCACPAFTCRLERDLDGGDFTYFVTSRFRYFDGTSDLVSTQSTIETTNVVTFSTVSSSDDDDNNSSSSGDDDDNNSSSSGDDDDNNSSSSNVDDDDDSGSGSGSGSSSSASTVAFSFALLFLAVLF